MSFIFKLLSYNTVVCMYKKNDEPVQKHDFKKIAANKSFDQNTEQEQKINNHCFSITSLQNSESRKQLLLKFCIQAFYKNNPTLFYLLNILRLFKVKNYPTLT